MTVLSLVTGRIVPPLGLIRNADPNAAVTINIDQLNAQGSWITIATSTDLDAAETSAKASAVVASTRIRINGQEYQVYGRSSIGA
jgi:hypothetical protein